MFAVVKAAPTARFDGKPFGNTVEQDNVSHRNYTYCTFR